MKWPLTLTLIRHDESAYNALKKARKTDPLYIEFAREFELDPTSTRTRELALELKQTKRLGLGDYNTPLAEGAGHQAKTMATQLKGMIHLPDIVFVSPYERTLHTLAHMQEGWPELAQVRTIEDSRVREQEHGLLLAYNDWKVFCAIYPDQKDLRELEGKYYYRFPQGESVEDVRERTRSWFGALIRDFAGKHVLVVTHHLTILAVRANLERLNAEQFLDLDENQTPLNAGATIYRGDPNQGTNGKLILDQYNLKLY